MFPLSDYVYNIPSGDEPGGFGFNRKYDIHTGVDLYTQQWESVFTIEAGIVVNVLPFTGILADSPWWFDTQAVMVEGESGVILYGELKPIVKVGDVLEEGSYIGSVERVLKQDKGKVPSTSMLHMELYKHGTREPVWWKLEEDKPEVLLDITTLLQKQWERKK